MIKKWMLCVKPTRTLKKGVRYLIECRGKKAKVLTDEFNPHHIYGNVVNMNRFETIKN